MKKLFTFLGIMLIGLGIKAATTINGKDYDTLWNPFGGHLQYVTTVDSNTITGSGGITVTTTTAGVNISGTGSGGGGSSSLAVSKNGVIVSSPTAVINFTGSNISVSLTGGATAQVSVSGTSPGGSNTNVQFSSNSTFGGDNGFQYDSSVSSVTLGGGLSTGGKITAADSSVIPLKVLSHTSGFGSGTTIDFYTDDGAIKNFGYDSTDAVFGMKSPTGLRQWGIASKFSSHAPQTRFYDGTGSNYVSFRASGTTTTTEYVLPNATGSSGQVLSIQGIENNGFETTVPLKWATSSGSGGSSSLAVGTGTATNFTNQISSPTSNLGFNGAHFNVLGNGTTAMISINQSSVTVQGTFVAGTNITLTPSGGITTIAASGGGGSPGGSSSQIQYNNAGSFNGVVYSSVGAFGNIFLGVSTNTVVPLIVNSTTIYSATLNGANPGTPNVQEWKDMQGNKLAYIDNSGGIDAYSVTSGASDVYMGPDNDSPNFGGLWIGQSSHISTNYSFLGNTTLTIFNAVQTLNFRAGNTGAMLVDYNGGVPRVITGYLPSSSSGDTSANLSVITPNGTYKGIVIRGSSGQSANLFECQNSNALPITSISAYGHYNSTGTAPTLSSCGTTPGIVGDDYQGTITVGGGVVTACTMTFANSYNVTPTCQISDNSTTITGDISSLSATAATFSFSASLGGGLIYYHCGCSGSSCQ